MFGLPLKDLPPDLESVRGFLESHARHGLALQLTENGGKRTHLGGLPSGGAGFEWPAIEGLPLPFVGQLDFGELRHDALPSSGILSMFFDVEEGPFVAPSDVRWRFLLLENEATQDMVAPEGTPEAPAKHFAPAPFLALPHRRDAELNELLSDGQYECYVQYINELQEGQNPTVSGLYDDHLVLGHDGPAAARSEVAELWGVPIAETRLLWQIPSCDPEWRWGGEFSTLLVYIQSAALGRHDFSDLKVVMGTE